MNEDKQIQNINVDLIIPNRFQPRLTFDENALNELAASIKEHGIIQPLVLRKVNDKYEIIAGERRYKASCLAGLTEVPAIITNIDDEKSAELALVENVQRKNLNSMEEARSYKKMLDKGNLTQEALAQKIGISQSTLANKLRLLNLAPEVQDALLNNKISERHARSLLIVNDPLRQISLLNKVIAERLTVRQLDAIIKENKDVIVVNENPAPIKEETKMEPNNSNEPINIFDNNEIDMPTIEEPVIEPINEPIAPTETIVEPLEEPTPAENAPEEVVDTLNTLDEEKNDNKFAAAFSNILNKMSGPEYPSLEDETVNMNLDTNDYFNPFNNLNEAESLPIKEEPVETLSVLDEEEPKEEENKEEVIEKDVIISNDLDSVKKAYNNLKEEIKKAGFNIAVEEFDFEDIYQLIIKIDKQA